MKVECPYCGKDTVLEDGSKLYGDNTSISDRKVWICWPCFAYVGCHKGKFDGWEEGAKPMGTPAKKGLRGARIALHDEFDKLWQVVGMKRTGAYQWLAERLGIPSENCHIGMFDRKTCEEAMGHVSGLLEGLGYGKEAGTNQGGDQGDR